MDLAMDLAVQVHLAFARDIGKRLLAGEELDTCEVMLVWNQLPVPVGGSLLPILHATYGVLDATTPDTPTRAAIDWVKKLQATHGEDLKRFASEGFLRRLGKALAKDPEIDAKMNTELYREAQYALKHVTAAGEGMSWSILGAANRCYGKDLDITRAVDAGALKAPRFQEIYRQNGMSRWAIPQHLLTNEKE